MWKIGSSDWKVKLSNHFISLHLTFLFSGKYLMVMHDVPYAYHCQSSAREIFFVCIFFHFLGPVSEIEISLDRKKKPTWKDSLFCECYRYHNGLIQSLLIYLYCCLSWIFGSFKGINIFELAELKSSRSLDN